MSGGTEYGNNEMEQQRLERKCKCNVGEAK